MRRREGEKENGREREREAKGRKAAPRLSFRPQLLVKRLGERPLMATTFDLEGLKRTWK